MPGLVSVWADSLHFRQLQYLLCWRMYLFRPPGLVNIVRAWTLRQNTHMSDKSRVCASFLGASLGHRDSLPDSTLSHPLPLKEASAMQGGEHDAIMGTARNLLEVFFQK